MVPPLRYAERGRKKGKTIFWTRKSRRGDLAISQRDGKVEDMKTSLADLLFHMEKKKRGGGGFVLCRDRKQRPGVPCPTWGRREGGSKEGKQS